MHKAVWDQAANIKKGLGTALHLVESEGLAETLQGGPRAEATSF